MFHIVTEHLSRILEWFSSVVQAQSPSGSGKLFANSSLAAGLRSQFLTMQISPWQPPPPEQPVETDRYREKPEGKNIPNRCLKTLYNQSEKQHIINYVIFYWPYILTLVNMEGKHNEKMRRQEGSMTIIELTYHSPPPGHQ